MKLRFVTAASLFDGHDVSINIMRRLLQSKGVEVIHLGHNRSAHDVVKAVIQEDAHAVAISSYQGGHVEYFSYIRELLNDYGAKKVRIFGGGGGVIVPKEIELLEKERGITKIYSPEDGRKMGLEGIIEDMISKASYDTVEGLNFGKFSFSSKDYFNISKIITTIENCGEIPIDIKKKRNIPILGVTGTGGAGKSSLIDELLLRFHRYYSDKSIALISVDPTKKRTKGALLGDRIRLNSASFPNIFVRSLATRDSGTELSPQISRVVDFLKSTDFDLIVVESSGIGQASDAITKVADKCIYVMTPEYGAQTQLEKIEMIEAADMIVINKFEKMHSEDAIRDVRKQFRRDRKLFVGHPGSPSDEELPVFGTRASKFNDEGVNALFAHICGEISWGNETFAEMTQDRSPAKKTSIISEDRILYLRDISKACRDYNLETQNIARVLESYEALERSLKLVGENSELQDKFKEIKNSIPNFVFSELSLYHEIRSQYLSGKFTYSVRGRDIHVETKYRSLSLSSVSRVASPSFSSVVDIFKFQRNQNFPGYFPFASGIFPFRRNDEDPKRMFAGEGGPKRTNKRFHYLSEGEPFKRLSTAFDSVTLYGADPDKRPDIFGKIGEAGVSIATLRDMKDLFAGFDLVNPTTSVSMTINGPAPIILAMFMNTAIEQNLKGKDREDKGKQIEVMQQVRGTVQADILKEDQAQNTCIFSLEFSLKMMGDVQAFFCKNKIKNYYTVSISGYHIAEAGANPITQAAFTLANGFTYVEYYLSRGMKIDDFCQNLSFFFSNGLDPEYAVIGRVARKIWAVTLKNKYGASEKSQKFKYHIQTSGRSLHAQEIAFNDIRTTLQAFLALSDNCNSLHTNAYDEAVTTPTEESVRRAMAIQMVINKEFGLNKSDNPLQGSFLLDELADIVEGAILDEFDRISDKGGVLGAMESMYQRSKIQEESLYYETLKDSGEYPIIGVNTFIAKDLEDKMSQEINLSRSSDEEKFEQIDRLNDFKKAAGDKGKSALERLKNVALTDGNIFEELLHTVRHCSLGEISQLLFEVGGQYRRNM